MSDHFWPRINVINTIRLIKCNSVTQEMIALEGRVNSENPFSPVSALNIMKEDCYYGHVPTQQFRQMSANLTSVIEWIFFVRRYQDRTGSIFQLANPRLVQFYGQP